MSSDIALLRFIIAKAPRLLPAGDEIVFEFAFNWSASLDLVAKLVEAATDNAFEKSAKSASSG